MTNNTQAKPVSLKDRVAQPEALTGGHRLCAGCAESVVVRQVLSAIDEPVVVVAATGCLEVATTIYPYTAWNTPFFHSAFENAGASVSGAEAAYRALRRKGRIPDRDIRFIAFGGDGSTYDIGLQSLSGALERGHRFVYICLNNEGYMNTGTQRSSATPTGAHTTTTPIGAQRAGKIEWRKNLTAIIAAHNIPYIAQAAPLLSRPHDLRMKAAKAFAAQGPSFLNVLSPCTRGWRYEAQDLAKITQLAADTCYWPIFEVVEGRWRLTYKPKAKLPIADWLGAQGRFRHLLAEENEELVAGIQSRIDREWEALLARCDVQP